MKLIAIFSFLTIMAMFPVYADQAVADVITVEFIDVTSLPSVADAIVEQYGVTQTQAQQMANGGWHWAHTWGNNGDYEDMLNVVIRRNGQVIRNTSGQKRHETESDVNSLALDINTLYPQLWEKEAQISAKKSEIASYLSNPQQDKSHPPYLDELVQLKEERQEIQYEIDQKTNEIINEEGSGSLGWYYLN